MDAQRELCTFHVDRYIFGVDVSVVQEVLVEQTITPVPLAPPSVHGIINLRGQIIGAIDLRTRLSLGESAVPCRVSVVVLVDDEPVAFQVERAGDVVRVDAAQFERTPDTVQLQARELILGAYKQPDHLVLLLDSTRAANPQADHRAAEAGEL